MRLPKRYQSIEDKKEIHRSLKTDSKREALVRRPLVEASIIADLDARLTVGMGQKKNANGDEVYAAALAMAKTRGFSYQPVAALAEAPLDDILARVEKLAPQDGPEVVAALLGDVETPTLKISELPAEVERLAEQDNRFKSTEQMRLWRTPLIRAVTNLREALKEKGKEPKDIAVIDITNAHARKHRKWWEDKIENEDLTAETANKDFSNMAGMLHRFYKK